MNPEIENSEIDKMLAGDRAIFDGMASALLEKKGKIDELKRVISIENLIEATNILRGFGITNQEMADYLKTRETRMVKAFNERRRKG